MGWLFAFVTCAAIIEGTVTTWAEQWIYHLPLLYPLLLMLCGASVLQRFEVISPRARYGLSALFIGVMVLYGVFVYDPHQTAELWRLCLLCVSATFGFALLPWTIARGERATRVIWSFALRFISCVAMVGVFTGALWIGLMIAIVGRQGAALALDPRVERPSAASRALMWLGVFPWGVVSTIGVFATKEPLEDEAIMPLLRLATTYIFAPLIVLYLGMLAIYQISSVAKGIHDMPSNMMSPLLLGASALILISLVVADRIALGARTRADLRAPEPLAARRRAVFDPRRDVGRLAAHRTVRLDGVSHAAPTAVVCARRSVRPRHDPARAPPPRPRPDRARHLRRGADHRRPRAVEA